MPAFNRCNASFTSVRSRFGAAVLPKGDLRPVPDERLVMTERSQRGATEDSFLEDEWAAFPRTLSRGRAFVYVLACRNDTLSKIGFTRDPLIRWRTLHRRFFELFDLDGGILVSTERVKDARNLERTLIVAFMNCSALASPMARISAGGHTEWFRGVTTEAMDLARDIALKNAWDWERPADWLRSFLAERRHLLFSWTATMLEVIEFERHNENAEASQVVSRYESALTDALDVFHTVGLDVDAQLPDPVRCWYRSRR